MQTAVTVKHYCKTLATTLLCWADGASSYISLSQGGLDMLVVRHASRVEDAVSSGSDVKCTLDGTTDTKVQRAQGSTCVRTRGRAKVGTVLGVRVISGFKGCSSQSSLLSLVSMPFSLKEDNPRWPRIAEAQNPHLLALHGDA